MKIGKLEFENPFVLAPLAGITDKTMRTLCAKQGASLVYTEMVSGKGLYYGDKKTESLLEIGEEEGAVAFQIFGSEPEVMEYATKMLAVPKGRKGSRGAVLIDLNGGCPVPKIVKNHEGSALLKDIDALHDVVAAMVKGSQSAAVEAGLDRSDAMPITAKIRMGFYRDENVAVEAAKAVEAAGAAAITVHGRTREQYYEGNADWTPIAQVKKAVNITVIGNGDVMCGRDGMRMLEETGCDGVMIARGALGNPWIFSDANACLCGKEYNAPSNADRIEMLIYHLTKVAEDKGEDKAVREIRKHVGWYIKGMRGSAEVRRRTNQITSVEELKEILKFLS